MGLDLKARLSATEGQEIDPDDFLPMALVCGNHHLLEKMLKGIGREPGEGESIVSDEEYAEMDRRMVSDMEPIMDDPLAGKSLKDILAAQDINNLGIKVIDDDPPKRDPVQVAEE